MLCRLLLFRVVGWIWLSRGRSSGPFLKAGACRGLLLSRLVLLHPALPSATPVHPTLAGVAKRLLLLGKEDAISFHIVSSWVTLCMEDALRGKQLFGW